MTQLLELLDVEAAKLQNRLNAVKQAEQLVNGLMGALESRPRRRMSIAARRRIGRGVRYAAKARRAAKR